MSRQWSYCFWDKKQPRSLTGCNAIQPDQININLYLFGGKTKVTVDDRIKNLESTTLVCKCGWMFMTE